jgi:hypothetical protein
VAHQARFAEARGDRHLQPVALRRRPDRQGERPRYTGGHPAALRDHNRFEAAIERSGTAIVKLYLHISEEEQRRRLVGRLNDPDKHWKFSDGDIKERRHWAAYQQAYATALGRCSPTASPWYVIPANRKWYRNWAVTQILIEEMEAMKSNYPNPHLDVRALKRSLSSSLHLQRAA